MKLRACISLFATLVMACPLYLSAAEGSAPSDSDRQLATRLAQQAQLLGRVEKITDQHYRKMEAMLDAAHKCDPKDLQITRMHLEIAQQLGLKEAAIEDLTSIRDLAPNDHNTQLQIVSTHLSNIESVEKKITYLQGIIPNAKVPAEVRSILATINASLLEENGRKDEALKMLDEAIKLNPLNATALEVIYDRRAPKATEKQRFSILISRVRANPTTPIVLQMVGRMLADAGMVTESTTWFKAAMDNATAAKNGLTLDMMTDLACSLILSDRSPQAQEILNNILTLAPSEYTTLILRNIVEKDQGKPDAEKFLTQARNVLINTLNETRSKIGIIGATTRPINEGEIFMPDIASDSKKVEEATKENREKYILALMELSWFEVFFQDKVDQADKHFSQLLTLLSEQDRANIAILPRISGWIYLKQGRKGDAAVKFGASADHDPMSELGAIRLLAADDRKAAAERAQKLLDAMPGGLNGVVLNDHLKDLGVHPRPTALAPEYTAILSTLPQNWLSINTRPAGFYSLRVDPVSISTPFGQPILVNVTLQNTSSVDLSIAQDGVIQPGIWFDAQVSGSINASIPGIAYQTFNDALVLKARGSIKTVVRIDQQQLVGILNDQPSAAISIRVIARTNPVYASGIATSGPAGFVTDRSSPFQRAAFPVSTESLSKTVANVQSGPASQRFAAIQLLTQLVLNSKNTPNPLIQSRKDEILLTFGNIARESSDPAMAAWVNYNLALIKPSDNIPDHIASMLQADSDWRTQILGIYALDTLGFKPEQQKPVLEKLLNSSPTTRIKNYAEAFSKILTTPKP